MDTILMTPEEIEALLREKPFITPDRPGLWEFRHNDGHTEVIRAKWVELGQEINGVDAKVLEPVGMNFPGTTFRDLQGAGQFTRFLGR